MTATSSPCTRDEAPGPLRTFSRARARARTGPAAVEGRSRAICSPRTRQRPAHVPGRRSGRWDGSSTIPGRLLLRACRPRQWLKNLLVALAPAAAGVLTRPGVMAEAACAFASFCLLSSATYLVNDVRDREQDRRHPRKRFRPVAAGELAPRGALRLATVIAALGLALAVAVRPMLGLVAIGYLTLTTSYSICWRRIVVADVVAVAGGFVVRAIGGGVATGVALSYSFLIVTSACALMIVVGSGTPSSFEAGRGPRPGRRCGATRVARYEGSDRVRALGCAAYAWWRSPAGARNVAGAVDSPVRSVARPVPQDAWSGGRRGARGADSARPSAARAESCLGRVVH